MPQTFTQTFADGSHVTFSGPGFGQGQTPTPQPQQLAPPTNTGPQLGYNPNGAQWSIGWSHGKGVAVAIVAIVGFAALWAISGQWSGVADCTGTCKDIQTAKINAEKEVRLREVAASEKISGDDSEARKVEAQNRTPVIAAPVVATQPAVFVPTAVAAALAYAAPPAPPRSSGGAPIAGYVLPHGMVPGEWRATGNTKVVPHGARVDTRPHPCVRFEVQGECGLKLRE